MAFFYYTIGGLFVIVRFSWIGAPRRVLLINYPTTVQVFSASFFSMLAALLVYFEGSKPNVQFELAKLI